MSVALRDGRVFHDMLSLSPCGENGDQDPVATSNESSLVYAPIDNGHIACSPSNDIDIHETIDFFSPCVGGRTGKPNFTLPAGISNGLCRSV